MMVVPVVMTMMIVVPVVMSTCFLLIQACVSFGGAYTSMHLFTQMAFSDIQAFGTRGVRSEMVALNQVRPSVAADSS
jgi:hypothetical protein